MSRLFPALILFFISSSTLAQVVAIPAPPAIAAKAWILVDYATGKVMAEKNITQELPPASLTKVMTAYIVFQQLQDGHVKLTDNVTVSEKAWRMKGSRMFIEVGKQVRVEDLLRGLIIQSGNDAAVALAEHIAGSESGFVELMNHHALRLGMLNTHFVNVTGWPDTDHYSTVGDLIRVTSSLIKQFPEYYHFFAERQFNFNNISQTNRNILLWQDETVDGLKTGHTEVAGYCLLASAKRGEMRLISVILGAKSKSNRAKYTQNLFNYGFRFYDTAKLFTAGETLKTVKVWKGKQRRLNIGPADDIYVTIPRGQYDKLQASMDVQLDIDAPVQAGDIYGKGRVQLLDSLVTEFPLVALEEVADGGFFQQVRDSLLKIFN